MSGLSLHLLVAVSGGAVEMTVAGVESVLDSPGDLARGTPPGAQTQQGHQAARVQLDTRETFHTADRTQTETGELWKYKLTDKIVD